MFDTEPTTVSNGVAIPYKKPTPTFIGNLHIKIIKATPIYSHTQS